jgi:hypothetical protein
MDDERFDGTELDFWLGDWDLTWDGGHGTNRLTRILDDRVILEEFEETVDSGIGAAEPGAEAADPAGDPALHGRSWSVFDASRGLWRQTWVDSQGAYLDLTGTRAERCFAFERAAPERGGEVRQRMVFRDVTRDAFRWTWEMSPDGGATSAPRWAIDYRRSTAGS